VLPLAVTTIAYERTKGRQPSLPVIRWPSSPRPPRPRDPAYDWGVGLGIVVPWIVAAALHAFGAPEGTGGALFLGTILACWAIHVFARHRTSFFGAVPWGMVLGVVVLPCVLGLVLVPILEMTGL
jgi:hypothetical protein